MTLAPDLGAGRYAAELREHGFCIIEDAVPQSAIEALNADLSPIFEATPFCDGDFYGRSTKRFGGLLKRSAHAATIVQHGLILQIADELLSPHCECFNLNLTQGIEIHPGAPAQFPHRDEDMWQGPKGELQYLVNVMWPLSLFRSDNGATLIWRDSHEKRRENELRESPLTAETEPGSALLFLGSTLHAGGANRSNDIRRGLIISYCLGWLKPFENQWLVYPPSVARDFPDDLAALVGYQQHRPNLGNVEGQCPSLLLKDKIAQHLAAIDALRPTQAEALAQFVKQGSRLTQSQ